MIYLGIDPGVRTGAAYLSVSKDSIDMVAYFDIPTGVEGFNAWWHEQTFVVERQGVAAIVMEDFVNREGKHGVDHTPERVIGAASVLAGQLRIPVILRPPSGRNKQVPDRILKRLGLHLPGEPNRNAREAVRHTVAWLKAQKNPTVLQAFQA